MTDAGGPGVPGRLGKPLPSTQAENEPEGGEGRAGEGRGREGRENVVAQAAAAVRQLSSTRLSGRADLYWELVKKMVLFLVICVSSWLC